MEKLQKKTQRFAELDLLRGFFIFVIIVDHLQFWPNPFQYITGEGRLWVSAAEGFFLISGLLIGHIRAYKNRALPLKKVSKGLLKRAAVLYLWGVAITFCLLTFSLMIGGTNGHPLLPKLPDQADLASLPHLIWSVLSMNYFSDWIYFLRLYAIMLLSTPLFLWLLRRKKEWLIVLLSAAAFAIGLYVDEAALQWQLLFFGAALFGYHLTTIKEWLSCHKKIKYYGGFGLLLVTAVTMYVSYFFVLGWNKVEDPNWTFMDRVTYVGIREILDPWFSNSPIAIGRILLAFIWFAGVLFLFHIAKKSINRWLGWLLLTLGERSLSAYCLQALIPAVITTTIPVGTNPLLNAMITVGAVLCVWLLLRIPFIQRIIPR